MLLGCCLRRCGASRATCTAATVFVLPIIKPIVQMAIVYSPECEDEENEDDDDDDSDTAGKGEDE